MRLAFLWNAGDSFEYQDQQQKIPAFLVADGARLRHVAVCAVVVDIF